MTFLQSMGCWEITKCQNSSLCVARQNPEKKCWELSAEHGDMQCAYNVCSDCIVYLAKKEPAVFTEKQVLEIIDNRRYLAPAYRKSLSLNHFRKARNNTDRREDTRIRCNGNSRAIITSDDIYQHCRILDLSQNGLALLYPGDTGRSQSVFTMDLMVEGTSLPGLYGEVVSDTPVPSEATAARRCGVRFDQLTQGQRNQLADIVQNGGVF